MYKEQKRHLNACTPSQSGTNKYESGLNVVAKSKQQGFNNLYAEGNLSKPRKMSKAVTVSLAVLILLHAQLS